MHLKFNYVVRQLIRRLQTCLEDPAAEQLRAEERRRVVAVAPREEEHVGPVRREAPEGPVARGEGRVVRVVGAEERGGDGRRRAALEARAVGAVDAEREAVAAESMCSGSCASGSSRSTEIC